MVEDNRPTPDPDIYRMGESVDKAKKALQLLLESGCGLIVYGRKKEAATGYVVNYSTSQIYLVAPTPDRLLQALREDTQKKPQQRLLTSWVEKVMRADKVLDIETMEEESYMVQSGNMRIVYINQASVLPTEALEAIEVLKQKYQERKRQPSDS